LERQKQNYAAASEHLEQAVDLARATFIRAWLARSLNALLKVVDSPYDDSRFLELQYIIQTIPPSWVSEPSY
jgi:uncharacterized protein HemY